MEKIIFDTDIGSDIDDAFALGYLLNHPECELLGITTVSGEAEKRAALCQLFVDRSGKTVPVHSGISKPIAYEELQPRCPQARVLERFSPTGSVSEKSAVDFIRQTVRN